MLESFVDNLTEWRWAESPQRNARRLVFAQTYPAGRQRLGIGAANAAVAGQAASFHS